MMSEADISQLMTVAEAIAVIDAEEVSPRVVEVHLADADGLVLAEDVKADRDYPPFDKSQMDGFAVRAEDVREAGVELKVVGEIAAGVWPEKQVGSGETMAIMTGAPMPAGANAVIPVEETERVGEMVRVRAAAVAGKYIAPKGSDVGAGTVVLEKGMRVGPAALAVLSSVGKRVVRVYARPTVAVLGTGDELVGVDEKPGRAQIRNSNNIMLASLMKRMGCEVRDLGIVKDDPKAIRKAIEEGMRSDVLMVTGGMSMGEFDFVPKVLQEMDVKFRVTKLRIKPGKPFVFGVQTLAGFETSTAGTYVRKDLRYVFGLPGNPLSGFVCAVRLASRLIQRLAGGRVLERWVEGKLAEDLPANGAREFYQPVVVEDGVVKVLGWKGSADLYSLAKANGLLVRQEKEGEKKAGEVVGVFAAPM